jgi:hypothetical protein
VIKKHYKAAIFVGAMALALAGIGTVKALQLKKADEVQLKLAMKPVVPVGDRTVDLIGIFPPGFDTEVASAKADYEKEYGAGNFQVVSYKGYTIIVPPAKNGELAKSERDVDTQIASAQSDAPSASLQASQIAQIRNVFGTAGDIAYNPFMGAYTDEKGFQYNFYQGELVGKQVGVTSSLAAKFDSAYPHFKEGAVPAGAATLTEAQAKAGADKVVSKALGAKAASVMAKAGFLPLSGPRLGITYGDNEVEVLVDTVSGDIIHYSRSK